MSARLSDSLPPTANQPPARSSQGARSQTMRLIAVAGAALFASTSVGEAIETAHAYLKRREYEKKLSIVALEVIDQTLDRYANRGDFTCLISRSLPKNPVRIEGENAIYDKSWLEEAQKRDGTSPTTRKPFDPENIVIAWDGVAAKVKVCDEILKKEQEHYEGDLLQAIEKHQKKWSSELEKHTKRAMNQLNKMRGKRPDWKIEVLADELINRLNPDLGKYRAQR